MPISSRIFRPNITRVVARTVVGIKSTFSGNCSGAMAMLSPSRYFPPAEMAEAEGLLCIGGKLSPAWLLDAYRHAIFPWPVFDELESMAWWSPDPRAIFKLQDFHTSRRLRQTLRSGKFEVTCDRDFQAVVCRCATAQERRGATWILPELIEAYQELHRLGHAHSVEVWHDGALAGGVYGVAIAGLFAGESMFYNVRDASKVALAHLVAHLTERGYELFDIQQLTPHTRSLGAIEITRREYLTRLAEALESEVSFGARLEGQPEI